MKAQRNIDKGFIESTGHGSRGMAYKTGSRKRTEKSEVVQGTKGEEKRPKMRLEIKLTNVNVAHSKEIKSGRQY